MEVFGQCRGFKVCMGAHYLRVNIGDGESKPDCIKNCAEKWEKDICDLRKKADKYPWGTYSEAEHVVQLEWIFFNA